MCMGGAKAKMMARVDGATASASLYETIRLNIRFIYRGNLALPFPVVLFKTGQVMEMKVSS